MRGRGKERLPYRPTNEKQVLRVSTAAREEGFLSLIANHLPPHRLGM